MKTAYTVPAMTRRDVRVIIERHYKDYTDKEIGNVFGLSAVYVRAVRNRMGLTKSYIVMSEIRGARKRRRTKRIHRRMDDGEKFDKQMAKKAKEDKQEVERTPETAEEWDAYMRAKGYGVV